MNKTFIQLILIVGLTTLACTLFSCDKDEKDDPISQTVTVSANDLLFGTSKGEKQTVSITCKTTWSASTDASWIDLSPKNGNGNGYLTITVNSDNNTSSERSADIRVSSGEYFETITVSQKASLTADCTVSPDEIVTLGNQFAFNVTWAKNVAYFQWGVVEEKDLKRMSDAEIVTMLEKNDRIVEKDDYFHICVSLDNEYYLTPLTEYIILTLAHDDKGNRGEIVKKSVTTRGLSNQAAAYISDIHYSNNRWAWTTTINPYASEYYTLQMTADTLEDTFILDYDIVPAYVLAYNVKRYPDKYPPAIQTGNWWYSNSGDVFYTCSWAKDKNGNWSGIIDTAWDWISATGIIAADSKAASLGVNKSKVLRNGTYCIKDFGNIAITKQRSNYL